jgi:hypothetical protein
MRRPPRALREWGVALLAARIGPAVCLLPIGGVVVDWPPWRLSMLAGDFGRGITVGLMALAAATWAARLWQLFVMAVIMTRLTPSPLPLRVSALRS